MRGKLSIRILVPNSDLTPFAITHDEVTYEIQQRSGNHPGREPYCCANHGIRGPCPSDEARASGAQISQKERAHRRQADEAQGIERELIKMNRQLPSSPTIPASFRP
jgi:hypothetical protein